MWWHAERYLSRGEERGERGGCACEARCPRRVASVHPLDAVAEAVHQDAVDVGLVKHPHRVLVEVHHHRVDRVDARLALAPREERAPEERAGERRHLPEQRPPQREVEALAREGVGVLGVLRLRLGADEPELGHLRPPVGWPPRPGLLRVVEPCGGGRGGVGEGRRELRRELRIAPRELRRVARAEAYSCSPASPPYSSRPASPAARPTPSEGSFPRACRPSSGAHAAARAPAPPASSPRRGARRARAAEATWPSARGRPRARR